MDVRVRFAPSPTGLMHMGNARTAFFNWLFARKNNGKFILRIEDTDVERSTDVFTEAITQDLSWLHLNWDEGYDKGGEYGPYRQKDRGALYQKHLNVLKEKGVVYPCYCTPEDLDEMRKNQIAKGQMPRYDSRCRYLKDSQRDQYERENKSFVWRFAVPKSTIVVQDMIRGDVTFDSDRVSDFVLTKSSGSVTFHFAVAVDDACMKISHVIRGEDHLTNTAKHVLLFDALSYERPKFAHMPMILGPDGSKLSKRNGLSSLADYRKQGFLPEAILNYMSFLGWAPQKYEDKEIFSLGELSKYFDVGDIGKSPSMFDFVKLKWVNSKYLSRLDIDHLTTMALPLLRESEFIKDDVSEENFVQVKNIVALVQDQINSLSELPSLCEMYFKDTLTHEDPEVKVVLEERTNKEILLTFKEILKDLEEFSDKNLKETFKMVQKKIGVKGKALYLPIRLALSSKMDGAELYKMIQVLGKKRCIDRINKAILL
ncbi:glutamate--tRNA ligase [PVC group bacterium (ex Bugula neritina AB1)]|nr:glutamate--tRNA ligase [PVC group bacterium (ex Bugula neritina AB1)]